MKFSTGGSLAIRQYSTVPGMPAGLDRTGTFAINRYSFRPCDARRGEKESFGWIEPRQPLAEKLAWESVVEDNLVYLAARRDKKALNPILRRANIARRIEEVRQAKKIERLTRQHRLAIEEEVEARLLAEAAASSSFVEVVWDTNTGEVLVGCASNSMCDRMRDLFVATFDLPLQIQDPARRAHAWRLERDPDLAEPTADWGASFGSDFLTWIFARQRQVAMAFTDKDLAIELRGPIATVIEEKKLSFQGDDAEESVWLAAGIARGGTIRRAGAQAVEGENLWKFTMADSFGLSGVRLPVPQVPDNCEQLQLRCQAASALLRTIGSTFAEFLAVRLDDEQWKAEQARWLEVLA